MPKIFETGHAVNLSNFKKIIDQCDTFGTDYTPSNTDLTVANMTTKWTTAGTAHQILTTAIADSKNPINAREILFAPVNKLVTRTIRYFDSTKASKQIKKDARGLADKIRGFNVKVKKQPDGSPDPNDVSKSHQSFVMKADTFKALIDTYASDPLYTPNEAELKLTALTTLYNAMKASNDGIGLIIAPVDTARITRDTELYKDESGVLPIAQSCKNYVKGAFGARDPRTKLVTKFKLTYPPQGTRGITN